MKDQQTFLRSEEQAERDLLVKDVIRGYCQSIPYSAFERVMNIYHRYGIWAALEAVAAAILAHEMSRESSACGGGPV